MSEAISGKAVPGCRRFAPHPGSEATSARLPMIQGRRLGHPTFSTPDLDGQVSYYSDVLGLRVIERGKDRAFLACRSGLEAIALERGEAVALQRLSFQVAPGSD